MENNLIEIFTGSEIDANYIASILSENEIDFILVNTLNQSVSAGWASGSSYNCSIIRVHFEDADRTLKLINEYSESLDK